MRIRAEIERRYWVARGRLRHYGRAWRYAVGRMTEFDAYDISHDCEDVCGEYALESMSRDAVLEIARERYGDAPELERIVTDACSRVARKWTSDGHMRDAAEGWALDLVAEYARDHGVVLVDRWDDTAMADAEEER